MPKETCLDRLIRICGNVPIEVARRCNVTRQMVNQWKKNGYIPAIHAIKVEEASGGIVLAKQVIEEANAVLSGARRGKRKAA